MEGIYLPEIIGIPLDFKVSAAFPVEDLERFETLRDSWEFQNALFHIQGGFETLRDSWEFQNVPNPPLEM